MKKTILLLLFGTIAHLTFGQSIITLDLPDPCSSVSSIHNEAGITKVGFDFIVVPNPSDGKFTLNIYSDDALDMVEITLINMQGISVLQDKIFSHNKQIIKTMDISYLPDGIYLISLWGKNDRKSKKLILNKN